jgi:hypothetical protein
VFDDTPVAGLERKQCRAVQRNLLSRSHFATSTKSSHPNRECKYPGRQRVPSISGGAFFFSYAQQRAGGSDCAYLLFAEGEAPEPKSICAADINQAALCSIPQRPWGAKQRSANAFQAGAHQTDHLSHRYRFYRACLEKIKQGYTYRGSSLMSCSRSKPANCLTR